MAQPRRTQAERSAHTRGALVHAAAEVIAARGYPEATLQQIAERAGVSKGAVHHHFPSKQSLLPLVLEHCAAQLAARAEEAWRAPQAPGERIRAALRALWTAQRERGPESVALVSLVALAAHDPVVRAPVAALLARTERRLADAIDAMANASGLRPRAPSSALAALALALFQGAALRHAAGAAAEGERDEGPVAALEAVALAAFTV